MYFYTHSSRSLAIDTSSVVAYWVISGPWNTFFFLRSHFFILFYFIFAWRTSNDVRRVCCLHFSHSLLSFRYIFLFIAHDLDVCRYFLPPDFCAKREKETFIFIFWLGDFGPGSILALWPYTLCTERVPKNVLWMERTKSLLSSVKSGKQVVIVYATAVVNGLV